MDDNAMYNITNFVWDIATVSLYIVICVLILYVSFRIIAHLVTIAYNRAYYSKEVKSITIPLEDDFEPSSENIRKLTGKMNLAKEGNNLSVKNIMHISTTASDKGASCTIWYSAKRRKVYIKPYSKILKNSYSGLNVLDGD